jgi:hypothetical protein
MIEDLVWLFSAVMVIVTVSLHYEVMTFVSDKVIPWAQKRVHSRRVMAYAIGGLLLGHIIEIWLFALVMRTLVYFPLFGSVQGDFGSSWEDFLYLSAVNYTSLGDNVIHVVGPTRALTATESLAGMMMIAWSASFAYLKMEMIWERRRARRD